MLSAGPYRVSQTKDEPMIVSSVSVMVEFLEVAFSTMEVNWEAIRADKELWVTFRAVILTRRNFF